jgi:hypothetical protein
MRLSLQGVGGFAGPAGAQTRAVDLDRLPAAEAAHLRALVAALDLAHLPAALMKPRPQSWDFVFTLTVDDGDVRRQVRFHADAAPPALRELADILNRLPPA